MNKKIPKHVRVVRDSDGSKWWEYNPPINVVALGIVHPMRCEAERWKSFQLIEEQNKKLEECKKRQISSKIPTDKSTVYALFRFYQTTHSFNKLREQTKRDYRNLVQSALMTRVGSKTLQNIKLGQLSRADIKVAYEKWLQRGVRTANITHSVLRKVLNVAIEYDIIPSNPLIGIEKQKELPRKVMWTQDQVRMFLDMAYSKWKWRNIGLISHMAYEWCQRVGDMRTLKWISVNLDEQLLTLEQSKRRAEVFLPISDNLARMLRKQKDDFGFQEYVAPSVKPFKGGYRPYSSTQVSAFANQIKDACGLPSELQIMDMRRTGITEMVESGVDITQIMSVSGHQNVQSVTPYVKHTLNSSKSALSKRQSLY